MTDKIFQVSGSPSWTPGPHSPQGGGGARTSMYSQPVDSNNKHQWLTRRSMDDGCLSCSGLLVSPCNARGRAAVLLSCPRVFWWRMIHGSLTRTRIQSVPCTACSMQRLAVAHRCNPICKLSMTRLTLATPIPRDLRDCGICGLSVARWYRRVWRRRDVRISNTLITSCFPIMGLTAAWCYTAACGAYWLHPLLVDGWGCRIKVGAIDAAALGPFLK